MSAIQSLILLCTILSVCSSPFGLLQGQEGKAYDKDEAQGRHTNLDKQQQSEGVLSSLYHTIVGGADEKVIQEDPATASKVVPSLLPFLYFFLPDIKVAHLLQRQMISDS